MPHRSAGSDEGPGSTYTANIDLSVSSFGEESTFTLPVTFTVDP